MRLREYPGFLPGVVLSFLVAVVFAGLVARSLGVSRFIAFGLVVGLGLAISATIAPGGDAIRSGVQGSGTCDLGRLSLAPLSEVLRLSETGLNVILMAPLGLAVGLMPRSRTKLLLVVGSLALPFMIEAVQLVATPLGRACQGADVIDNLTGLVIGLVIGAVLGAIRKATASTDPSKEGVDPA